MAGEEIGAASFGLIVGLNKFRSQLSEGEKIAGQSAQRMGDALGQGIDRSLSAGLTKFGDSARRLGGQMQTVGRDLSIGLTAPLVAVGGLSVKAAIDFETAFAGVRKTVEATEQQFATLETGIRDMSKRLPQSAVEIARVVEAAGQLGIAVPNMLSFTETMIGLGVATDMSSEDAATALARLANITQMPQSEFNRLGSTVVELGNKLAATESEIVNMGLRLAGAGKTVGLTEAQILGLAGAMSSVGIEAEAGGTAMSRVLVDMAAAVNAGGDNLLEFAKVAGMSASQFSSAFKNDPALAIQSFVAGLQRVDQTGGDLFGTLESLGLSEVRVRDMLLRLAGAGDILTTSVASANEAWQENNALQTEVAARNETFAAQWQIFKNRITDVAISLGEALIPSLLKLMESAQPVLDLLVGLVQWFTDLPEPVQTTVIGVLALTAALGPLVYLAGTMVTTIGSMSKALAIVIPLLRSTGLIAAASNPYVLAFVAALAGTALIIANWDKVKKWFTDFKSWLARFGKTMWDGIVAGFKAAINVIIRAWNSLSFTVPSISAFGRKIGGQTIGVPKIPELGGGGTVTQAGRVLVGERGVPEVLELPRAARVTPLDRVGTTGSHAAMRPIEVVLQLDRRVLSRVVVDEMADRERVTGRPAFGRR